MINAHNNVVKKYNNMPKEEIVEFYKNNDTQLALVFYAKGKISHYVTYDDIANGESYEYIFFNENMFHEAQNYFESTNRKSLLVTDNSHSNIFILYRKPDSVNAYKHEYYDIDAKLCLWEMIDQVGYINIDQFNQYSFEAYRICFSYNPQLKFICKDNLWVAIKNILGLQNISFEEYSNTDALFLYDMKKTREINDEIGLQSRVEKRIYSYDEFLHLLLFFANKKIFGNLYQDKNFFVIRDSFIIQGICSMKNIILDIANAVAFRGYIPVVDLSSSDLSIYSDYHGDEIWTKFFEQVSEYDLADVYSSYNVTIKPNGSTDFTIYYLNQILKNDKPIKVKYSNSVMMDLKKNEDTYCNIINESLGVLIRGTDYNAWIDKDHAKQASADEVINKIYEVMEEWKNYQNIYLATEDKEIYETLKNEFGSRLFVNEQQRFSLQKYKKVLYFAYDMKQKNGYKNGFDYIQTLWMLSKCESLIASGNCGGTYEALELNDGNYKNIYIFNKTR